MKFGDIDEKWVKGENLRVGMGIHELEAEEK